MGRRAAPPTSPQAPRTQVAQATESLALSTQSFAWPGILPNRVTSGWCQRTPPRSSKQSRAERRHEGYGRSTWGSLRYGLNRRRSATDGESGNWRAGSESVTPAKSRSAFWICSGLIRIPFGSSISVDGLNFFALKFASVPPITRPPAIPAPMNIMLVMFPRNKEQRRK